MYKSDTFVYSLSAFGVGFIIFVSFLPVSLTRVRLSLFCHYFISDLASILQAYS